MSSAAIIKSTAAARRRKKASFQEELVLPYKSRDQTLMKRLVSLFVWRIFTDQFFRGAQNEVLEFTVSSSSFSKKYFLNGGYYNNEWAPLSICSQWIGLLFKVFAWDLLACDFGFWKESQAIQNFLGH